MGEVEELRQKLFIKSQKRGELAKLARETKVDFFVLRNFVVGRTKNPSYDLVKKITGAVE